MIYPTSTGKPGEYFRLNTLESVWIQGKLRMWGRWSYIGSGKPGNMFNQLLASRKLTKTAINEALRRLKKSGTSKPDLEAFLREMMNGKQKSWMAHCTDSEAMLIDRVIGTVLAEYPALKKLIHQRYEGRGMSKRKMAEQLNELHPDWCLRTCKNRIDQWLCTAENALYVPLCEAYGLDVTRFEN
ncbi:DUF1133 family protein [Salmonella enterica]|uniref:DUF1133 family protein n=1 Tax=Salmonella enterica TaxID=28901 RepID=A0A747DLV5_SALER|nr:DUF1133 family protein [Salmonella enterica]EBV7022445.1 DUF1133 family protein [Salmonella enterica subsp. enterica serovar Gaminara]EBN0717075.1 DUF1133 family protein [Salmonella enterica]EBQ8548688.1 DUF1133 family protein [Salmonella enterica]ECA8796954.1 DUF1133 family protein [Salmonella enterica subsp. enterica serovar Gaminara]